MTSEDKGGQYRAEAVMKKSMRGKIRGMAAGTTVVAVSLVAIWAGISSAKKKEKAYRFCVEGKDGAGGDHAGCGRADR